MTARFAVAALVAFFGFAPSAVAVPHHSFASSFGVSGTGGSQFGTGSPTGAAVNQTTGDLYVADSANSRIERFQADGTFVSAFGWGVDDGTAVAQVCTSSCQAGISGSGAGQLATPAFVAVDNSAGIGAGAVYVADTTNNTVSKFDASGNYISSNGGFTATDGPFGPLAGIAVNASGELWVYDQNAVMFKFAQDGTFITDFNTGFGVTAAGIAVDPSGNLYIVRGIPYVQKISATGADLGQVTADSNATGLAIDPATGELYVGQGTTVERFAPSCDPSGGPCAISETFGSPDITAGSGIAIRASDSRAYVADPANTQIDTFDFSDPAIATTSPATTVHHTSAVLNGHLDPGADPGITNCQFDWVDDAQFQVDAFASADTADCAEGDTHAAPADVTAQLGGLTPGTTYHYRLHITTTSSGDVTGSDRSFTPAAFPVRRDEIATFGPDGTSATSFTDQLGPLAFDQGSRKLYAHDNGAPGIFGFSASAPPTFAPLSGFTPLSTIDAANYATIAVDNTALATAGNIYYSASVFGSTGLVYGFAADGSPLGGNFPIDLEMNPGGAAGSPKAPYGAAVDPAGNLWISNILTNQVLEYSSAGAFMSSIDVSANSTAPSSLAFDSNSNLYVGVIYGSTWKYTAASGYTSSSLVDSGSQQALAVDRATNHLYVAHGTDVTEYDPAGASIGDFATGVANAVFRGVAVDSTNHDVFVSDSGNHKIHAFGPGVVVTAPTVTPGSPSAITATSATLHAAVDPNGFAVTDCHFEYGRTTAYGQTVPCTPGPGSGSGDVSVSAAISGLTPGTDYHFRIVVSNATPGGNAMGDDQTLNTPGPVVGNPSTTAVTDTAATMRGTVNPRGQSTAYRFEYVTDADFQASGYSRAARVPLAPASIGAGATNKSVAERVGGLAPGTAYHFRLVATNATATTPGSDATFKTFAAAAPAAPCANDGLRAGPGANLPDCRAYEMASPPDKNGANISHSYTLVQAARSGGRITFANAGGLPTTGGTTNPTAYVASRGNDGWTTNGLQAAGDPGLNSKLLGWDEDLLSSVSVVGRRAAGASGLYLGDIATGTFHQAAPVDANAYLAGFAADTSHLIFDTLGSELAPGAVPGAYNLYDLNDGAITLAGRIPAGSATTCDDAGASPCVPAPAGSFAGPYDWVGHDTSRGGVIPGYLTQHTISADGSKVFFTAAGSGQLYMRKNGTRTTKISASQRATPDPSGPKPAAFVAATPSGSKVFFTSCERLTDDSTASSTSDNACNEIDGYPVGPFVQGSDLYSYDTSSGHLSDLSVDGNPGDTKGAEVTGVLGASSDGSDIYYVANGVMAAGATRGTCTIFNRSFFQGECNLYLSHNGDAPVFIARLSDADSANWVPAPSGVAANGRHVSRVAANGTLIFMSKRSLTGYDNRGVDATSCGGVGFPCFELFRYAPGGSGLTCLSCNPTGAAPDGTGEPELASGGDSFGADPYMTLLSRNISADGNRVFFDTPEPLVADDTNGADTCRNHVAGGVRLGTQTCMDVYEWEAAGTGSCHSAAFSGGCIYLLSSGKSSEPSFLADVSESGDDAFIFTDEPLVGQDRDQLTDAYDVRVGGGLAAQHPSAVIPCTGDACQGPATPPLPLASIGSIDFPGSASAPGSDRPVAASVSVSRLRAVTGTAASLKVKVPAAGRISVSGSSVRKARKAAPKAATYTVTVALSTKARQTLKKKQKLVVKVSVVFEPSSGRAASKTVAITFKQPKASKKHPERARRATTNVGGSK